MIDLVKTILCGSYVRGLGRPLPFICYPFLIVVVLFALFCILGPFAAGSGGTASGGLVLLFFVAVTMPLLYAKPRSSPWFVYDETGALITREPKPSRRRF